MDSEHNMRVNAHDDQLAIHSSVVFGRRARIVYDALVDQFFLPRDAVCYAFETQNFFDTPYLGITVNVSVSFRLICQNNKVLLFSNDEKVKLHTGFLFCMSST